jgi:hypothetical protein
MATTPFAALWNALPQIYVSNRLSGSVVAIRAVVCWPWTDASMSASDPKQTLVAVPPSDFASEILGWARPKFSHGQMVSV